MKVRALGLILVVVIAACLPPSGRPFRTTLFRGSPDSPGGDHPLPVLLGDQTNLVLGIQPAEREPIGGGPGPFLRPEPGDPYALNLYWLGGLCDSDASISFKASGSGFDLHLEVHEKLGFGCPAAGILRGLRITTLEAIPIDSIALSGGG